MLKTLLDEEIDYTICEEGEAPPVKQETIPTSTPKKCQLPKCRTKLMLVDFACRCSRFYCSSHRFSEDHQCTFNYKVN
jgi:hypothetical protein